MSWLQISFVVDAQQVSALSSTLEAFLAQAVTTENAGADEFYEVAFPGVPDWRKVAVTALFAEAVEPQPIIDYVLRKFDGAGGEIPTEVTRLKDQDWERVWLENFRPIEVGERLWVCPSWCEPDAPDERNIMLDPGLAFGTGTHPTTGMCLAWLSRQDLHGQHVLDYGAGSGILAIASLMSGAAHADAVDVDPLAVTAAQQNAQRNGFARNFRSCLPAQLPEQQYPLVIANILAEVIIELRDTLLLHLAPGGTLLLTGILQTQAERVIAAYNAKDGQLEFRIKQQEQWSMLVGRQNSR